MPEEHITLYGDSAEAFRDVKDAIEEQRGIEPGNAEAVRVLIGRVDL